MYLTRLILLLVHAYTISATPLISVNICNIVTDVVAGLHAYTSADTFCTGFISIRTSTITATSTLTPSNVIIIDSLTQTASPTPVTSTISATATITSTTPILLTPTSTVTTTSVSTNALTCLSTATTVGVAAVQKRHVSSTTSKATLSTSAVTLITSSKLSSVISTSQATTASCAVPTQLQIWGSSVLSTACSCLSLPTPSTTVTATTTIPAVTVASTVVTTATPVTTIFTTVTATLTQFASTTSTVDAVTSTVTSSTTTTTVTPTGLAYYYYYPETLTANYRNVAQIITDVSNNPNYQYSGAVQNINSIFIPLGQEFTLPNSNNQVPGTGFALIFQGYLYASAGAGTYSVVSPGGQLDDTGAVWVGLKAYGSNWNYGNADYVAEFPSGGSVSVTLADGEAVPINIYFENGGGQGDTAYDIVTPDGTTHSDTTPFFVGACGGVGFDP